MKMRKISNKKIIIILTLGISLLLIILINCISDEAGYLSLGSKNPYSVKKISLVSNNIYDTGFQGILDDISSELKIPEELYLESDDYIDIQFEANGTIKYINAELYGKDDDGNTKIYEIYYNKDRYNKMKVKYKNTDSDKYKNRYNESKSVKTLLDTMKAIKIKDSINQLQENNSDESDNIYGVFYSGKRLWKEGTEGIRYIDNNGKIIDNSVIEYDIVERTVSVYVPGEEKVNPIRYILIDNDEYKEDTGSDIIKNCDVAIGNGEQQISEKGDIVFKIDENIKFYLEKVSKKSGGTIYNLYKVNGETYDIINKDIFISKFQDVYRMKFLSEELGFLFVSKGSGSVGILYRTEDGGKSFWEVKYYEDIENNIAFEGEDGEGMIFGFPLDVYKEDENVYLKVGESIDNSEEGITIQLRR